MRSYPIMPRISKSLITPLFLFSCSILFYGLYAGIYEPSFNNYLAQVHHVSEVARGGLEFPRELPGFLCVFIVALLVFLADTRIAMLAALMLAVSLFGQGFLSPKMSLVVFWMLLWSTGAHLFMVLRSSIVLRLAQKGHEGKLLGDLGALEACGLLVGMVIVYFGTGKLNFSFPIIFAAAGFFALMAAICLFLIKPAPITRPPRQLMLKRKYTLFYLLNVIYGARKQIFLTFAPWVLIQSFQCGVHTFALLGIIGTIIGLVFRPLLGRAVDYWGERTVLSIDSVFIITICIFYAFSSRWFPPETALTVIMACYIIDQLLFATTMARTTYLNRIAESTADLAPTLSMGLTLDHAVSMSVPFAGGLLWAAYGYQSVFFAAAVIGGLNFITTRFIPSRDQLAQDFRMDSGV